MSLDWDLGDDWKNLKSDENWPITNGLVWETMRVDIGTITEKNIPLWLARMELTDGLYGPSMSDENGPRPFTREDLEMRIGLSTNVATTTDAAFFKKIRKVYEYHIQDHTKK